MSKKAINRLKAVLAEQGKTNKWLAEELNKNETTISRWCTDFFWVQAYEKRCRCVNTLYTFLPMNKHTTPLHPVGESSNRTLAQPSDSTITFLMNFARLYEPMVEKPQAGKLMN